MVTAAASLITSLAQKSPDDFKTSVSLAVARLSRVGVFLKHIDVYILLTEEVKSKVQFLSLVIKSPLVIRLRL